MENELKCSVCQSELEKIGDTYHCKTCGFGFKPSKDGKIPNKEDILKDTKFELGMLRLLFPTSSAKQLSAKHQFHEHRMKDHPTTKDGYCEFCGERWEKLSDQEFKEKLGYNKSSWYNTDGTPLKDKEFWNTLGKK